MERFVDSVKLENGYENVTEVIRKKSFTGLNEKELLEYALNNCPRQFWEQKVPYIVALVDEWRLRQRQK